MKGFILLVEDNEQIMQGNERMLKRRGYEVAAALTLKEARAAIAQRMPDVIVLDIMLPDGNGLDFMGELRRTSETPVLLLTGLTTPQDVINGLNTGSDDYLTKPYDFGVLLARIEALVRRAERIPQIVKKGRFEFNIMANQAFLDGKDLLLTQKEFAVLLLLVKNEGRALPPEYIYETLWKQPMAGDDSAVKNTVSRVRKKLGDGFIIEHDKDEDGYIINSVNGA